MGEVNPKPQGMHGFSVSPSPYHPTGHIWQLPAVPVKPVVPVQPNPAKQPQVPDSGEATCPGGQAVELATHAALLLDPAGLLDPYGQGRHSSLLPPGE